MGVGAGIALKSLQWFNRGIQFACCGLILALTSYFLAAMSDHKITIPTNLRAVEGISGIGVLYTAFGILLVCCLAGFTLTSFIAIVLDIAFVGAFIYVATVYKDGTSSCSGDNVKTVFGTGSASSTVSSSSGGGVPLPSYRTACRMESANLAVAIVAIFFFIFSAATELLLGRHRKKEQRFGPSPANNYTSGYGSTSRRTGFLGSIFGRRAAKDTTYNENELPTHPEPDELRMSYNTETTHVDPNTTNGYGNSYVDTSTHNKYGDTGPLGANAGYPHASNMHNNATNTTVPDTGYGNMGTQATPNYRYSDGTYNV